MYINITCGKEAIMYTLLVLFLAFCFWWGGWGGYQKIAKTKKGIIFFVCNDFTPTLLNALGIHNLITGEKGVANGALEKMAIGRLLVSVSTSLLSLAFTFNLLPPEEHAVRPLAQSHTRRPPPAKSKKDGRGSVRAHLLKQH